MDTSGHILIMHQGEFLHFYATYDCVTCFAIILLRTRIYSYIQKHPLIVLLKIWEDIRVMVKSGAMRV